MKAASAAVLAALAAGPALANDPLPNTAKGRSDGSGAVFQEGMPSEGFTPVPKVLGSKKKQEESSSDLPGRRLVPLNSPKTPVVEMRGKEPPLGAAELSRPERASQAQGLDASPASSPAGPPGPAGSEAEPEREQTRQDAGTQATRRASQRARSLAERLRPPQPAEDAPPGGGGRAGESAGPRAAAEGAPPSPELVAAAASPAFRPVFREAGLKLGAGPDGRLAVLDAAGRPAKPEAVESLRERIESQPEALMKRPDLFRVISQERYGRLREFAAFPGAAAAPPFRDIGLTSRDFVWTRSCARVSGDCNPFAEETSYRRHEQVSPETLKRVHKAVMKASGGDEKAWAAYVRRQREQYERERAERDGERLLGAAERALRRLRGQDFDGLEGPRGPSVAASPGTRDADRGGTASSAAGPRGLRARDPGLPAAAEETPRAVPADALALGGAAALAVLLVLLRRRRRRRS